MRTFRKKTITPGALVVLLLLAFSANVNGEQFSWQKPHAKITPEGDLQWAPEPFVFEPGDSVRYIDYDNGSDENPGTKEKPWRHHPWDPAAKANAAQCTGIQTYVFKKGVIYRGQIIAKESGKPANPIKLTCDPAWGSGESAIYGSRRITDGWKKCDQSTAPNVPGPEKVWYKDIGRPQPRCLWELRDGKVIRVKLARTPNWSVTNPDDIKSEWYIWQDAERVEVETPDGKQGRVWCIDPRHLTATDPDAYDGATVWTEYVSVMGTPYACAVEKYDPARHAVLIGGPWGEARSNYSPISHCRYFLENLPAMLDSPGEYYYAADGPNPGRLYVRLGDDRNPNESVIELANNIAAIDIRSQSHIHITGLTFRFGNAAQWHERWWTIPEEDGASVKAIGDCKDIRVSNCRFEHVMTAVWMQAKGDSAVLSDIAVTDNDISHTDYGAINIAQGGGREQLSGELLNVEVLRNKLYHIGLRPLRAQHGHALVVNFPTTAEVAGNFLDRCYGAGLFIFGGKGGGNLYDKPLARILIHHNKVTDPLLNTNDWGGIESWQGGPTYIFDNISGNPGGFWFWKHTFSKGKPDRDHATARFGFAYYLDGAFKQYVFNNIGWGKSNDLTSPLCNTTALQEIIGFQNAAFNNTFYKFAAGSRRQVPNAGRNSYLGNLWLDISEMYFRHSDAEAKDENLHQITDIVTEREPYAYDSLAYSNNVFYGKPKSVGLFEHEGMLRQSVETYSAALKAKGALASQVGWAVDKSPVRDAESHDFRPTADSAAIDRGVKFFIPWSLYAVVGEWNFYKNNADATKILGENWYMTDEYTGRDMYRFIPRNDLTAQNVTADDFTKGQLDDWTEGALTFNGKDTYCILKDADQKSSYTYSARRREVTCPGEKRRTLDIGTGNFLIEAFLKTAEGSTAGCIASKAGDVGYILDIDDKGRPRFTVKSAAGQCSRTGNTAVNDGKWHHIIAELDRVRPQGMNIYIDGKLDNAALSGSMPKPNDSLVSSADFLVGKGPDGNYFAGAIDFLRVSRGTLEDARTTIEELYAWQFDGPFLHDFFGNHPSGAKRDAGAIEYTSR